VDAEKKMDEFFKSKGKRGMKARGVVKRKPERHKEQKKRPRRLWEPGLQEQKKRFISNQRRKADQPNFTGGSRQGDRKAHVKGPNSKKVQTPFINEADEVNRQTRKTERKIGVEVLTKLCGAYGGTTRGAR